MFCVIGKGFSCGTLKICVARFCVSCVENYSFFITDQAVKKRRIACNSSDIHRYFQFDFIVDEYTRSRQLCQNGFGLLYQ